MSSDEPLQAECDDNRVHGKKKCNCYLHPVVDNSLVQSTAEIEFEKGLWGIISRGAPIESVHQFLGRHSDEQQRKWVNKLDPANYTPLHYAARRRDGSVDIVGLLLRLGADPNVATPETKMTPLMRAAACRHVGIVEMLLRAGAKKETVDHRNMTAFDWVEQNLFAAAAVSHDEATRQMLLAMLKPPAPLVVASEPDNRKEKEELLQQQQ